MSEYKFEEFEDSLLQKGYQEHFNGIDDQTVREQKTTHCDQQMIYRGLKRGSCYIACAVCLSCGYYEEF